MAGKNMINGRQTKVRFVKCPKCSRILPEPEQIPLYTCGGCGTVLQAKYYKGNKQAAVCTEEVAQANGIAHTCDRGESSGSSQRSSPSSEPSSAQNGGQDEKPGENLNCEQIGHEKFVHPPSLSEESNIREDDAHRRVIRLLKNLNGEVQQELDHIVSLNHADYQKQGQTLAANCDSRVSSTEDQRLIQNKEAEVLPMERKTTENGSSQDNKYDSIASQNQIRGVQITDGTSIPEDSEVINDKQQQQFARVSEAIQDEDGQREQGDETASDNQEVVRHLYSGREAPLLNGSESPEKPLQAITENPVGNYGSYHETPGETEKKLLVGEQSSADTSESGLNCFDTVVRAAEEKFGKEDGDGEEQNNSVECISEQIETVMLSLEASSTTEISEDGNDNILRGIRTNSEASRSYGVHDSTARDLKTDREKSGSDVPQVHQCGVDSLNRDILQQKVENYDDSAVNGSEQVRVTLSPDSMELAGTHEDGSLVKVLPRSPTKGSLAYDGSVSSCDGNDDQATGQPEHIYDETSLANEAVTRYVSAEGSRTNSKSGIQGQVKSSSSMLLGQKMKRSLVEEEGTVKDNGISGSNRARTYRAGLPPKPRVPLYPSSSEMAFETGSSSSYVPDELPSHWARDHPYRYDNPDPWLRQTYMQRGNMDRRRYSEVGWGESEFLPSYYNDEISGEIYHRSKYHGDMDRRRAGSWSQSGILPRMQYSGEVFNGRYHIREPLPRRHHDGRRWSAQLPPSAMYYRQAPLPYPSRETSWDTYDPYPASPPRFMDSVSYPWTHDTVSLSDDQRHKDQTMKRLYLKEKEKRQVVKRHLRPVAGGAPFVTCYFCFKLLELPEDFLLSRRRNHRLKCGACCNILEFSLENETSLAPCMPDYRAGAETDLDRDVSTASSSRMNHCQGSNLVSEEAQRHGRELLQRNSMDKEKGKLMSRNSRNRERTDGLHDTAAPSEQARQVKVTWQLPARSKSPLHRLMGYSSPEDLLTVQVAGDSDVE